ncbi:helix-turn-helix domain-containing protein [bacterium]|nr:helix-turn-helix domain-containing protein [bacterium]
MSKNPLGDYIRTRRDELNLSQNQLAKRAGVSHSYIKQLEEGLNPSTGRPISPTAATFAKLAKGLSRPSDPIDIDALLRISRGEAPLSREASRPLLAEVNHFAELEYPPTPQERLILAEMDQYKIGFGALSEPGFWSQPPEKRRPAFRYLEGIIEEAKEYYESRGGQHA